MKHDKRFSKDTLPRWVWVLLWPFIAIIPVVAVVVAFFVYQSFLSRVHIGIVIALSVIGAVFGSVVFKSYFKRK